MLRGFESHPAQQMAEFKKHNLRNKAKVDVNGYVAVYYPAHPNCWQNGCVYLHRLKMENKLGRYLRPEEIVHHKDENRGNNRITNLELTDSSEHRVEHAVRKGASPRIVVTCPTCKEEFKQRVKDQKYCSRECNLYSQRRCERPSKEELAALIESNSWLALGRKFGVSDNAVRKWARTYGLI